MLRTARGNGRTTLCGLLAATALLSTVLSPAIASDACYNKMYVLDYIQRLVEVFDNDCGVHVGTFGPYEPDRATDLTFTPDGEYLIVCNGTLGRGGVGLYDPETGDFIRWLMTQPSTTVYLNCVAWGPNGKLYITATDTDNQDHGYVIEYDFDNGTSQTVISGLRMIWGPAFSPDGHLFISEPFNDLVREYVYNGTEWNECDAPRSPLQVDYPVGITIGPDGHLYVARPYANLVYEYALQGNPLQWTPVGPLPCETLSQVVGLDIGPDGMLYMSCSTGDNVVKYDFETRTCEECIHYGAFSQPVAVAFRPFRDCNDNGVYDPEDIVSGYSQDCNANGIPDECDLAGDINGDGIVNIVDLAILLANYGRRVYECLP